MNIKALVIVASLSLLTYFSFSKKIIPNQITNEESSQTIDAFSIKNHAPFPIPYLALPKKAAQLPVEIENLKSEATCCQANTFQNSTNQISDNWNLAQYGLPSDTIMPFFSKRQAAKIVYFSERGIQTVWPSQNFFNSENQGNLYIGTTERVDQTRQERVDQIGKPQADGDPANPPQEGDNSISDKNSDVADIQNSKDGLIELSENAFEIANFKPGLRDNGEGFVPFGSDKLAALQGPDFPLQSNAKDNDSLKRVMATVFSLGHGGSLLLKVRGDGFILNKDGFEFSIYENAFRIADSNLIFQEFATVGVSDNPAPGSFKWFTCNPTQNKLAGCAGAVPTSEGGDHFDLSAVSMDRIRYIWIKDIGTNQNLPSKWPTEGVDLDAVRLHHAYKNK